MPCRFPSFGASLLPLLLGFGSCGSHTSLSGCRGPLSVGETQTWTVSIETDVSEPTVVLAATSSDERVVEILEVGEGVESPTLTVRAVGVGSAEITIRHRVEYTESEHSPLVVSVEAGELGATPTECVTLQ